MEKRHQVSDYNVVISDPIMVYRSPAEMKQAWGYYQFPRLYRTATGEILANWNYSDDSVLGEGRSVVAVKNAVSGDNGKTWTPVSDDEMFRYQIVYNDAPTKDGKYFVSFGGEDGVRISACQNTATPYAGGMATFWYGARQSKVYLASDIAKLTLTDSNGNAITKFQEPNTVQMNEYDPATGKITARAVTVNWRHMPVAAGVDGETQIITPQSRNWRINSSHGVVVKDGDLYYVLYSNGFDSSKSDIGEASASETCIYSNVYVFNSVDGGDTWNYLSQISANDIPNFKPELNVEGACEPTMGIMPDGKFLILFRSGDNNMPSYLTYSSDDCKTWSTPVQFDSLGVLPQLITLDCGVSIASYGRPGVFVKTTSDPAGRVWRDRIEIPLSPKSPTSNEARLSCCYTQLLPISPTSALLIYTDFHHPTGDGAFTKAILVREIRIELK